MTRVNEEANPHDIEYPDIPSIPEESDEERASLSTSPVNFPEFSPDTELVKPFKGILKKSNSVNVNCWTIELRFWKNLQVINILEFGIVQKFCLNENIEFYCLL